MIKIVNIEGLNFRKGPSTSYSILNVLNKGEKVNVINEFNGWSNILYKGIYGYVYSKYLDEEKFIPNIIYNNNIKRVLEIAKSKLDCKYIWGAEGPDKFDCSGLVYYIYKIQLGINVPRTSKEQSNYGTLIQKNELKPGDLIFFDTQGNNDLNVSHVGIYIGNNEFIHASSGSKKVIVSKLEGYYSRQYVNARRLI